MNKGVGINHSRTKSSKDLRVWTAKKLPSPGLLPRFHSSGCGQSYVQDSLPSKVFSHEIRARGQEIIISILYWRGRSPAFSSKMFFFFFFVFLLTLSYVQPIFVIKKKRFSGIKLLSQTYGIQSTMKMDPNRIDDFTGCVKLFWKKACLFLSFKCFVS